MAYAQLAGRDVLMARVRVPRTGCWHATLDVAADDATPFAGTRLALTLGEGEVTWPCTVVRGGPDGGGRYVCHVVGGAGGMARVLAGQSYTHVAASVPVADILAGAAERLSGRSSAPLLATELTAWSRVKGPASGQLGRVCEALLATWRVTPEGEVWVGTEAWPEAPSFAYEVTREEPSQAMDEIASERAFVLAPGMTLDGVRVEYVEHVIEARSMRTSVFYGVTP